MRTILPPLLQQYSLAELEALASLPEESPNPVLRVHLSGQIRYSNSPAKALLKKLGCDTNDTCPEQWLAPIALAQQFKRPVEIEVRLTDDAASRVDIPSSDEESLEHFQFIQPTRYYICKFAPVSDSNFVNIYVIDVTDRQYVQSELSASDALKRSILESALDCIITIDHTGRVIEWNPAAEQTFGYSRQQAFGQLIHELIMPPALRPLHVQGIENYLKTGQGPVLGKRIEVTAMRSDGSEFPVELAVSPIPLGDTTIFTAYVRDITERKRAEQALAVARDQALESSRLKSEFLATMSHEIRTPMNGVIGMSELLLETDLQPEQQEYASLILKEAEHLLGIINDILDFSKIEAGKLILDEQEFSPVQVIEGVAELLSAQASAKRLALMTFVAPDVPATLLGDAGRLRQVLLNLAGNAVKFTDTGEVTIRLECVAQQEQRVSLRCTVADTGIGISAEAQRLLFQPFTQVDGGPTRRHGGTGLGLAIARRLIHLMKGEMSVTSELGKGSTFCFTLELGCAVCSPPPLPTLVATLQGLRVLIVDDNATHRTILQLSLAHWGLSIDCASRGTEAIMMMMRAVTTNQPYALVIVDQMMPGMDGFALGQAILHEPELVDTRLIMLTAFDDRGQGQRALDAGFAAYLTKPVRQSRLFETITRVMHRQQSGGGETNRILNTVVAKPDTGLMDRASLQKVISHQKLNGAARVSPSVSELVEETDELIRSSPSPKTNTLLKAVPLNGKATSYLSPEILLVEDKEANQLVAMQQLAKLGYHADLAQNGQEALNRLLSQTHPYRLVLMDCQMPEMDGFEATRRIRQHEQAEGGHLPIIAMTAQALKDDRQRCLEVGMDDYISKPVRLDALSQVLGRWLV